jgi:hypothetical protein
MLLPTSPTAVSEISRDATAMRAPRGAARAEAADDDLATSLALGSTSIRRIEEESITVESHRKGDLQSELGRLLRDAAQGEWYGVDEPAPDTLEFHRLVQIPER